MRVSGAAAYRALLYGGCLILLGLGILTLCSCETAAPCDPVYTPNAHQAYACRP
jgi:hypothetical protein